ncbi:MAG TPA: hypothetical protein VMW34_11990 [Anaerolineales bacterium]|nr:hypothetical protein [Anaerolineales bacterium]
MKRLLTTMICLFILALPIQATAKNWTFAAHDGTIGGTAGKLDNIDQCNADGAGYDLQDKDGAIVWDQAGGRFLFYIYDGDSETAGSDPGVVAPVYCDGGAIGPGRWILVDIQTSGGLLQTLLDAKCDESTFGNAISTGLILDGTDLKTHASLQSIAGQTEADVSILETTADNTYNVVTSGGNLYVLRANAGNTALEFAAPSGTGAPVNATSPILVTPNIGAATGTSFTAAKVSGVPGQMAIYGGATTETWLWGFIAPDDMSDNVFIKPPDALPTAGNFLVFGVPDGSDISTGQYVTHTKEAAWTIVDSDTVTAVADGLQAFVVPASMNLMLLTDFTCSVADLNSAASDATTVVLRRVRAGTPQDMTSTGVTIEYNTYTASDETVNATYDDLATGDNIYVDVNAVTTAVQKGLSCTAVFSLP